MNHTPDRLQTLPVRGNSAGKDFRLPLPTVSDHIGRLGEITAPLLRRLDSLYPAAGNVIPEAQHQAGLVRIGIIGEMGSVVHTDVIVGQQHIAGPQLECQLVFGPFGNLQPSSETT